MTRQQPSSKSVPAARSAQRRPKPRILTQSLSGFGSAAAITAALLASAAIQAPATTYYWDADGLAAGNSTAGAGLGGSNTWDTATSLWWDLSSDTTWGNTNADIAIFTAPESSTATNTVTLTAGIVANRASFLRSNYVLAGGDLTLSGAGAGLHANLAESATINSQILGTAGLTKTGGGSIRLGNTGNTYAGTTTISNGTLIISDPAALGSDSSAVVVTGFNPSTGSINLRSFAGGSLVLDGLTSPITFTRDLSLQGQGSIMDRGGALISLGNNTLSGTVNMNQPFGGTNLNTSIISAHGTLSITGTLNVAGTHQTTFAGFGGTNQGGVANISITGPLTGAGTLSKTGGGTLFLSPSSSSGFSGGIRTGTGNAAGQSSIRITSAGALGTRTGATTTTTVLDLNGGILEVLMDSPNLLIGTTAPNIYQRASSTIHVDRGVNGTAMNGTLALGQILFEENLNLVFGGRNGYSITVGATPVQGGTNNSTFTNNLQGGLLTFTGAFWSNTDTAPRTLSVSGNGDTVISGNIIASNSDAGEDHSLTKTGTGTLSITNTGATLDGALNIQAGTVAINDWRSITNNTSAVNIGSGATAGVLSVTGNNVTLANLTTSKVINFPGTSGGASILANQTGTSPGLVFNGALTSQAAGAGNAKTLTLGGSNTFDNTINSIIPNAGTNAAAISLTKIDTGTWVLAGSNTYTGTTTISNGTLKLKANAATSTILADTSSVAFNATNVAAGGTLELVGQASVNNVETVAGLNAAAGSGTIKLTPGSGGTASLVFNGRAIADPATVNITGSNGTTNTVTLNGAPVGFVQPNLYFGGNHFAYNTATAAGALRAPVYGTDATFVNATAAATLPVGQNNYNLTGNITAQTTSTGASTLRMTGQTLTINPGATLTIRTGAAGTDGGILATGNASSTVTGGGISTGSSGSFQFRVDGASDSLTINSTMSAATTGGVTKSGLGTLILGGANAQTGAFSINEGTVELRAGAVMSGNNVAYNIRQGTTLNLNGVNSGNAIGQFSLAAGAVVTAGSAAATLTVGNNNGTGTAFGIMQDGAGVLSVVKQGTGGHTWSGLSTYTGSTTINSTGILAAPFLADGGSASSIGASSSAASNLVFGGASATQAYGGLNYTGTAAVETDRLFTFGGSAQASGARIQANGVNSAPIIFTNTGALAYTAGAGTVAQGLVLGGTSTGDNRFHPLIANAGAGTALTSVFKAEAGVWHLGNTGNSYTGATTILGGALGGTLGTTIPTASNLVLGGGGVLLSTGSITRTVGTGSNQLQWLANQTLASGQGGGFAAGDSQLTVDLGSGLQWGAQTGGFVGAGPLVLGSSVSLADTILENDFQLLSGEASSPAYTASTSAQTITLTGTTTSNLVLGQPISGPGIPTNSVITAVDSGTVFRINTTLTANTSASAVILAVPTRTITVNENGNTGADQAIITGNITSTNAIGITKAGAGTLVLRGANTYTGVTAINQGTIVVSSLGNSSSPGASSVGDSTFGNTDTGAVTLGVGTTSGILQYVGTGETSDRKIRLNATATTGSNQIHADGSGALILTNVANDLSVAAKTLNLRGTNASGNMITSQLSDNTGILSVTVDGSATWILTNGSNNYTGTTSASGGALGVGDNAALGSGNLDFNNGNLFAYGDDRTIGNVNRLLNSTTMGFLGDYSLTFSLPLTNLAAANGTNINNNIASGKALTFTGMTVDSLTGSGRTLTVDGGGYTIVDGNITTTTGFGMPITKTGNGTLELRGTGGNFNHGTVAANIVNIDIDRGALRIGDNEVIPHSGTAAAYGGVVLSPELVAGDTATLDLNGFNETITVLQMLGDGTSTIDNTSTNAASLTFGANNAAIVFTSTGARNIMNSGGGALSITKTGTAAASIPLGYTLTHTGSTAVNGGGSLTISSALNGTTGLSATGNSSLVINAGLTSTAVTSVAVGAGSTLNLSGDTLGNQLSQLTSLSLGNTGTGTANLTLNIGDLSAPGDGLNTDTLTLLGGGTLNFDPGLTNTITFNMTDAGLNAATTYTLLSVPGGALGLTAYGLGNFLQGATPGGFSSFTWDVQDTWVRITTGSLITGASYWTGTTNNTWNANANNWSLDKAASTAAASIPGQGTDVIFVADTIAGGTVATTLEQNFKIASLTFEASTTSSNTPSLVTVAPGALATNRLEIATQSSTAGIAITTGGPALASISAPVRLTGDQTWNVADAASNLRITGALQGGTDLDLEKIGAGKVTLGAAADTLFNTGGTAAANVTISNGTLEILNVGALGTTANSNLANIIINGSGVFYSSATTGTVANPITLNGSTLSAGAAAQIYSGAIVANSTAGSTIEMRDQNNLAPGTASRNITLAGVVSGPGKLIVNSVSALSQNNPLTGNLTLSNANTWSGGLDFNSGTVTATNVTALGTGNIAANNGRIIFATPGGTTFNLAQDISLGSGGTGILELGPDASGTPVTDMTVNVNGTVTLTGTGSTAALRIFQAADNFSVLDITNSVVLANEGSISVAGSTTRPATISGVISETGGARALFVNDDRGAWGQTNGILRLTGANTFTGNLTVDSGTLEFNTAQNIGSTTANSLGLGSAITLGPTATTLRFIGTSNQSTDRPISITSTAAGAITLSANGTGGASIEYAGVIQVPAADGTQITLTGLPGSAGIISGGLNQINNDGDGTVNNGTWTHQTGTSRIGDDFTATGATTILNLNSGLFQVRDDFVVTSSATVNLNGTGALSFNTPALSGDASLLLRDGATVNLGANDAVVATEFDRIFLSQDTDGAPTLLNMGTYNLTSGSGTVAGRLILGERAATRTGTIDGTGTLTINLGDIDLLRGTVNANLASIGTAGSLEKFGPGTVVLAGNNSGLTSTAATVVNEGTLELLYVNDNNTKVRTASALDMRGADLVLTGNNGAATAQSVNGFTLGAGGASTITLNPGTAGQDIVLNLGAITRANNAQDGTIRFVLPSGAQSSTNGITVNTLNNRTDAAGILGGYATVDDGTGVFFARNFSNSTAAANIVAANTTLTPSVTSWGTDLNISDSTGFTGTLVRSNINSLRFNAAGASSVNMAQGSILNLNTGGILVTSNVTSGTHGIFNGTLAAGPTPGQEIIVTQDSSQSFEIGADIRVNHNIVKSGTGTLELSGNNTFTGYLEIQNGTVQVSGSSAIGDTSLVTLSASRNTTFQLLSNETIGRLAGGQRQANSDYGTVAIGANTLTINQTAAGTTYNGFITGTGSLVKSGGDGTSRNLNLTNTSTGFTGALIVGGGLFHLSNIGQINASSVAINKAGTILFDNNTTTRSNTRILDSTAITLNSADGVTGEAVIATAVPRGLWFRTDQDSGTSNTETIGNLNFSSGANYATFEQSGGNSSRAIITANNFVRSNSATFDIRGRALGSTAGTGGQSRLTISDATNQTAFIGSMIGGASTAGTTLSIVPWAIGENMSGNLGNGNMGNSLTTYTAARGLRPLDFTTEYDTFATSSTAAAGVANVRESLTANVSVPASTTVNSLVLHNNDASTSAASSFSVSGAGASQTLAVTSGAMLFTSNTTATAARGITLNGFDSGITVGGTNEYVIHVVNPSVAANTTALTATISSPLTSTADITKSGRGTLILTAVSTAGGGVRKTTINEGTLEIPALNRIGGATGNLVFAGGTLRLGAGFADDISTRTISLLNGGGTIDTNGNNATLAGSLGSGIGGITKTGAGLLTLNGAATYSGETAITAGTVAVGVNNATGAGGNLSIAGTGTTAPNIATLDLGIRSINHGLVTTSGVNPQIVGTGTINASTGFFLNHTGNTQLDAVLAGAGGLLKAQANTVTLTGANTYTGTTEIQAGQINFATIGNVGGGASNLGAPTTTENGIIRTGLGGTGATLNYTGTGSTSNRIIAMQGTTGGLTITQSNTAGAALNLGVIQTEVAGAKILTLNGASTAANSIAGIHEGATGALSVTKAGTGTWVINGANTYTGNTLNSGGGVLRAGNSQSFGTVGTVTIQDTGTVLELANGVDISRPLTVSNTGNAKTLRLLSGATSGTYSGAVSIAETGPGNFIVNVDTAGSLTASGVISGGASSAHAGITKTGPGTLLLPSGIANTYRGVTAINDGIVNVQNAASLGAASEGTTVTSGATLQVEGGVAVGAEALTLNGTGEAGQNGALVNVSGANTAAGAVTLGAASTMSVDDGSLTLTGDVTLGANTLTSTGDNGGQTVINGNIAGNGGLTVNALGAAGHTLKLDPTTANTFTGATAINQNATLQAQDAGALGGTSGITVNGATATNAGGTLMLTGNGDRINDNATITLTSATSTAAEAPKFDTGGFSETVGALTLSGSSSTDIMIIDLQLTDLNNALTFAASNLNTWTGLLQIWNWSGIPASLGGGAGGAELDQVFVGGDASGLTTSQLSQITFFTDSGSTSPWGSGAFISSIGQVVPVPEPTGVAVGLALFGLAGWRERRRSAARRRDERLAGRN